ncbi:hypothetical protein BDD12DRAFT_859555 [Trichophaea hybrida]|nr:hypothetical protein BDD12DRAFT_859555 [Trichophaea hybrida]
MAELEGNFRSDNDLDDYLLSLAELEDEAPVTTPLQATVEESVKNVDLCITDGCMNIQDTLNFTNVCQSSETYPAHSGHIVAERLEPQEDMEYPFDISSQELGVEDDWIPEKENDKMSRGDGNIENDSNDIAADTYAMGTTPFINTQADTHLAGTIPETQEALNTGGSDDDPPEPFLFGAVIETAKAQRPAGEMEQPAKILTKSGFLALAGFRKCQNLTADSFQLTTGNTHQPLANNIGMKPFVRGRFPREVQPRSVVDGLSTRTIVKTCFRLGEALSVGIACKNMPYSAEVDDVLVELYARVSFSERIENRQNFQFLDLFHDRPPFLSGAFDYWKKCELWGAVSAVFLGSTGKGKTARVIGRMKTKDGGSGRTAFYIQILLIWEAEGNDIQFSRNILCI